MDLQQPNPAVPDLPYIRVGRDARGSTVWEVVVQVSTGAKALEICETLRKTLDLPEME
jgi:hypothetical protein